MYSSDLELGLIRKNSHTGRMLQQSILMNASDTEEILVNSNMRYIKKEVRIKSIDISEEDKKIIENTHYSELEKICREKMHLEERFFWQRQFYDNIKKFEKENDFYDK